MSVQESPYPRPLTPLESELISWVLPDDSTGYATYRDFISRSMVIGQGRRGEGEIILGSPGDRPDLDPPLPPVISFGAASTDGDDISVTVREIFEGQMSVEIVGRKTDRVPPDARITERWTYARWRPGNPCPQCARPAREIIVLPGPQPVVLTICAADRRLWIYDGPNAICRPIPVTNYYNELMLLKRIRDPKIALVSSKLFERLADHSDEELASAFAAYNRVKNKLELPAAGAGGSGRRRGLARRFLGFLTRT